MNELVTGPSGYTWVVERESDDTITLRRFATRENRRTVSKATVGEDLPWRPQ